MNRVVLLTPQRAIASTVDLDVRHAGTSPAPRVAAQARLGEKNDVDGWPGMQERPRSTRCPLPRAHAM